MMDAVLIMPESRDFYLLLVMPIAAYWLSASIFHLFDCHGWFQNYKIHDSEAAKKRNRATLPQVFRQVLAQQAIQVAFAFLVDRAISSSQSDAGMQPSVSETFVPVNDDKRWVQTNESFNDLYGDRNKQRTIWTTPEIGTIVLQLACAILFADFWQYLWHRIFHSNKFLYKHVHAVHHRLYVPYSYGALYSSLVEAFIVDTIGTTLTFYISGLSTLAATWFASLSIIKSVNDHSGYRFPYNPFNYVSSNTTDFHDVHHQSWGMKYNFSQVYLTIWVNLQLLTNQMSTWYIDLPLQDDLLGTTMPPEQVEATRRGKENVSVIGAKGVKAE